MGGESWPQDPAGVFGMNLRLLRGKLSQKELARQMTGRGHPWHQSTVYRIEQGKQTATYPEAKDLAEILHTSMERFSWTGPEANGTAYVYGAGARVSQSYEDVAEAVSRQLTDLDTADRVVAQQRDSKYERVREACEDVAARIEEYGLNEAVDEGIQRWRERTGREEDDDDDAEPDEEGQPGVVDQRDAEPAGLLRGQGVDGHQGQRAA